MRSVRALAAATLFATAASARSAGAAHVDISVNPLLGADAPAERGWQPFGVRLRGLGPGISRGNVELTNGSDVSTRAPFAVSAGEQLLVELYSHDGFGRGLEVVVRDEDGTVAQRAPVPSLRGDSPLLVDLGRTARLEAALRGEHVAVRRFARAWAPTAGLDLTVTHPLVDARSGDLQLPDRALGYADATVVLVSSDVLAALPEKKADVLVDWVYAGGSLAVTIDGESALGNPRLVALFGGRTSLEPAKELAERLDFEMADPDGNSPASASYSKNSAAPSEAVAAKLARPKGGKLSPTRYGSSRELGLGEVHALAFDPTSPAFVDDQWVRRSVVDLVRDAWDRRTVIVVAGDAAFDDAHTDSTRKLLDPNEGSRWSIWFSAIVLVVYALLAGPLSFRRAARRGTPLRAFVELPIWSFSAAALIVLVGAFAKGGRARARRLSVVECGAGERRGAVVRFRALFASSADSLRVTATDPSSLLDITGSSHVGRAVLLGHDTAELVDLHGRPWETVLVREDGMIDLKGAVQFVGEGADLAVQNDLPRDLVAVVARVPDGDVRYFPRIRKGERVRLDRGKALALPPSAVPAPLAPTLPSPHRLDAYRFASLADADVTGTSQAWSAVEDAGRDGSDFWPDDRPALIGELQRGTTEKPGIRSSPWTTTASSCACSGVVDERTGASRDTPPARHASLRRQRRGRRSLARRPARGDLRVHRPERRRKDDDHPHHGDAPRAVLRQGGDRGHRRGATIRSPCGELIGYMPDHAGVYERITVREYLEFFAVAAGVTARRSASTPRSSSPNLGDAFGPARGDAQQGHAAAPAARAQCSFTIPGCSCSTSPRAISIRARASRCAILLIELSTLGKTIFLSSHILTELDDVCTSVGILERGRLLIAGPLATIGRATLASVVPSRDDATSVVAETSAAAGPAPARHRVRLRVLGEAGDHLALLRAYPGVHGVSASAGGWLAVEHAGDERLVATLVRALVGAGADVVAVEPERAELERIFLEVTKGRSE